MLHASKITLLCHLTDTILRVHMHKSCNNICTCIGCVHVGRLNVGDQLLVCDGVSLLEVSHDEAAQALKDAMDMESVIQ